MTSMTSIVSLFILLLITYSYSVPVEKPFESSTPDYEFITGQTIVENESKIHMELVPDRESTVVPDIHNVRTVEESFTEEFTTISEPVHNEDDKRTIDEEKLIADDEKRAVDDEKLTVDDEKRAADDEKLTDDEEKRTIDDEKRAVDDEKLTADDEKRAVDDEKLVADDEKRAVDDEKLTVDDEKRAADDEKLTDDEEKRTIDDENRAVDNNDLFTTMDTPTKFNQRAISLSTVEPEVELTTSSKRDFLENDPEMTTDVPPSSSIELFGETTGLINNDNTEDTNKREFVGMGRSSSVTGMHRSSSSSSSFTKSGSSSSFGRMTGSSSSSFSRSRQSESSFMHANSRHGVRVF